MSVVVMWSGFIWEKSMFVSGLNRLAWQNNVKILSNIRYSFILADDIQLRKY